MAKARLQATVGMETGPFRRGLARIGKSVRRFKTSIVSPISNAFKSLAGAAFKGGTAIAVALGFAIKAGNDFRQSMARANTMLGLTESQLAGVSEKVTQLAGDLGLGKGSLADALFQVASAFPGIKSDDALDFLAKGLRAAVGGSTDAKTAIDGLTTVINSFGLTTADVGKVSDVLFTTIAQGKTTFEELSASIGKAATFAAQAGVSMESFFASLATVTKGGISTKEAVTGIRGAIVALLKPSDALKKQLKSIGETGESLLRSRGLQGAFKQVAEFAKGSSSELVKLIPLVEAIPAVLALSGTNASIAAGDLDAMKNSAGAAARAFDEMDKVRSWPKLWQRILGLVSRFGAAIDKAVSPAIEFLSLRIKDLATSAAFQRFLARVQSAATQISGIAAAIAIGGPAQEKAFAGLKLVITGIFANAANRFVDVLVKAAPFIGTAIGKAAFSPFESIGKRRDRRKIAESNVGLRSERELDELPLVQRLLTFSRLVNEEIERLKIEELQDETRKLAEKFGLVLDESDQVKAGMKLLKEAAKEASDAMSARAKVERDEAPTGGAVTGRARADVPIGVPTDTDLKFSSLRRIGANIIAGTTQGDPAKSIQKEQLTVQQRQLKKQSEMVVVMKRGFAKEGGASF